MIYLDNAATTRMLPEVFEAMRPYFTENYGNAGTVYGPGSQAKRAINDARERIAQSLGAESREIFFTSGGTESDNWALVGMAESCVQKGRHIITTQIEHHAVLHTCAYLEKRGYEITYLPVDGEGLVNLHSLQEAIRPDTILISVMTANNEVGSIEPIAEIGKLAREREICFHTDAVQAYGQLPLSVEELSVDLLSASAHKFHGPKGVGFLYVRKGVALPAFLHGGAQERSRRAGTENVPGIVGMGKAAELAHGELSAKSKHEKALQEHLLNRLMGEIAGCHLNGARDLRLPGNVNVSFDGVRGESLVILLDRAGICASSGSACTTGSMDPSHVLMAMGCTEERAYGALRLTFSEETTMDEVDTAATEIAQIVERLRRR